MSRVHTQIFLALSILLASSASTSSADLDRTLQGIRSSQNIIENEIRALQANKQFVLGSPTHQRLLTLERAALDVRLSIYEDNLKSIYGLDDRRNYYEGLSTEKEIANSTLVLVRTANLFRNPHGSYDARPSSLGLCTDAQVDSINRDRGATYKYERFNSEPPAGFCSSFKVGPNLLATAGHCVKSDSDCSTISFVAGYHMLLPGSTPHKNIPRSNIYKCKSIVKRELDSTSKADWALVTVDRDLSAMNTLPLSKPPQVRVQDEVTVVGYPMGLPVKIAGNANVRRLDSVFFVANMDTYGGNSGSTVVNTAELRNGKIQVEGILVRGEEDFESATPPLPCRISKRCDNTGCRGEDATYVSLVKDAIPTR